MVDRVDEVDGVDRCADCGAEIGDGERIYAVSDDSTICYSCATRRGGAYDELHDRWTTAPEATDLLERDRPR